MNDVILVLAGVAAGTYFAESIRKTVPVLDPNKSSTQESSSE